MGEWKRKRVKGDYHMIIEAIIKWRARELVLVSSRCSGWKHGEITRTAIIFDQACTIAAFDYCS